MNISNCPKHLIISFIKNDITYLPLRDRGINTIFKLKLLDNFKFIRRTILIVYYDYCLNLAWRFVDHNFRNVQNVIVFQLDKKNYCLLNEDFTYFTNKEILTLQDKDIIDNTICYLQSKLVLKQWL